MNSIFDLFGKYKKNQKIGKDSFVILILFGILFLVIVIPTGKSKTSNTKEEDTNITSINSKAESNQIIDNDNQSNDITEIYIDEIEAKLESILSTMEGVGSVRVMITANASEEDVLEKDIPNSQSNTYEIDSDGGTRTVTDSSNNESTVYITDSEGNKNPYVVKTIKPDIAGVVVIAAGGGNDDICKNITEVIQALFSIEAHKIKVVKMKS